jgi:EAL domain-containing protein (putative c-di-GMP-specific phosphodiesterase class I)
LKEIGFHIAIDDFGTGYSSLSREHELNVDCLKIDKEFINNLMQMNPELSFVSDIISMAHKVGHVVVAEGVEYEEQLQYLYRCGCDMVQGYLISRPIHEDAALELGRNSKTLDQILERNGAK